MNISVCIITKNQSPVLEGCLKRLLKYPWEIVVVDTGSDDNSVEVAKKYTESVYYFGWIDDFAAAKNYAVSKAKNDLVLVIDTDEYLMEVDVKTLERAILSNPGKVGCLRLESTFSINGEKRTSIDRLPRLFDRREFCFKGRIHEQIVRKDETRGELFDIPLKFSHEGYDLDGEARKEKAQRNISLLNKELEIKAAGLKREDYLKLNKKEQNDIAYLYYQLGKGYYFLGDYKRAKEYFDEGLSFDIDENLEYVVDMVNTYGYSCLNSGDLESCSLLFSVYDVFSKGADFCFLMGLINMQLTRFDEAVEEFKRATGFKEATVEGANSFLAFYNAGVIREVQGKTKEAKQFYQRCGNYEPAKKRIREMQ